MPGKLQSDINSQCCGSETEHDQIMLCDNEIVLDV